jgi:hypothetical protein
MPSVVRKYEEQLRTLVVPLIGPMPVAAITKGDILFAGPLCESVESRIRDLRPVLPPLESGCYPPICRPFVRAWSVLGPHAFVL